MANRRPQGYLDNDCEANIDENMCKLLDAIEESGGGGGSSLPAVTGIKMKAGSGISTTLTLENNQQLTSGVGGYQFVPIVKDSILSIFSGYDDIGDIVNPTSINSYLKTIPKYMNGLNINAPVNTNCYIKVCEMNNAEMSPQEYENYMVTGFTIADSLELLGDVEFDYDTYSYKCKKFNLSSMQILNFERQDIPSTLDDGVTRYWVGKYRNEYFQFINVTYDPDYANKPLYMVLTLQQCNPNKYEGSNEEIYTAPCIIKLADKLSDFNFENTIIKVQNTGDNGDFVVMAMQKTNDYIVHGETLKEMFSVGTTIPLYHGSVCDPVENFVEPKILYALKNEVRIFNENDMYGDTGRLQVKAIALGTSLKFNQEPTDMNDYQSGIVDFTIDMWIERDAIPSSQESRFSFQNHQDAVYMENYVYNED